MEDESHTGTKNRLAGLQRREGDPGMIRYRILHWVIRHATDLAFYLISNTPLICGNSIKFKKNNQCYLNVWDGGKIKSSVGLEGAFPHFQS